MSVNTDFGEAVQLNSKSITWVASPTAGVERKLLDRTGEEVVGATRFVCLPSESFFSTLRNGTEKVFVLQAKLVNVVGSKAVNCSMF